MAAAASTTTTSTSTAATASAAVTSGLGDIALDVAAAHVLTTHGRNSGLGLIRGREGNECKTLAGIVGVCDSAVLPEGLLQLIGASFLADVVDKQLGSLNLLASATTAATSTAATTPAASSVSALFSLRPGNVHLDCSAGNL